ncbi:DUF4097 family beta strand repeat protein [Vermiphilus pyriformis]|nr:MAG: DUF4097 family beta strand repeat protein [Vermiphilus pyriformis]
MMRIMQYSLILLASYNSLAAWSVQSLVDSVKSNVPFGKKEVVRPFTQEFDLTGKKILIIENPKGALEVKAEWNTPKLYMHSVVKAKTAPELDHMHIDAHPQGNDRFVIRTVSSSPSSGSAYVDHKIIVPAHVQVYIVSNQSNIMLSSIKNPVKITLDNGSISAHNAQGNLTALIKGSGSIKVAHAHQPFNFKVNKGTISIAKAEKGGVAYVDSGSITVEQAYVNGIQSLQLTSGYGDITLGLPISTNADIKASTGKGTIFCEHPITLKPFTAKLTPQTWKQMQLHVNGTLGTGEAIITANTNKGSIKIKEVIEQVKV